MAKVEEADADDIADVHLHCEVLIDDNSQVTNTIGQRCGVRIGLYLYKRIICEITVLTRKAEPGLRWVQAQSVAGNPTNSTRLITLSRRVPHERIRVLLVGVVIDL